MSSSTKYLYASGLLLVSLISATVVTAVADDRMPQIKSRISAPPLAERTRTDPIKKPAQIQPSQQHLYLIRTTLLLLDTANRTGNYSVLRDTAGPAFQQRHSAADLAIAFQKIRGTVDLAHAAIEIPSLTRQPVVTPEKQLHLVGILKGSPAPVAFEMIFEPVGGHWRLAALAVGAAPAV